MSFYKMWSDDKNDITQCTNVDMDHQILPNAKLSETKGGRSLLFILIWTASLNCMFFLKTFWNKNMNVTLNLQMIWLKCTAFL